jgi:hypothetical protein
MTGAGKSVIIADLLARIGHPFGLRLIVDSVSGGTENWTMRADENITEAEEKASKAFNQEFPDENSAFAPLNLLQKAEAAVPERERLDEDDQSRTESWHAFKTP